MKALEIKKLISDSLDEKRDSGNIPGSLELAGVSYDFSEGFTDKVIGMLSGATLTIVRDTEFKRSLNYAFYRIALTGAAAIIILMISIFIMQDSFSFNSFLGLGDSYDESIVYLLTGN
ncbi:MAG: hypothetical protein V1903_01410 [Bacteroidota bacterium]